MSFFIISFLLEQGDGDPAGKLLVCVKGLTYSSDFAWRLLEWIETNRHFGVDRIFAFFFHGAGEEIIKILEHYQKEGVVEALPFSLAGLDER